MNSKNDDVSKRIDYISDDDNDPVVLELDESNYYELAYTYLNWKNNGGYKKCKKCGKLFRVQTSPARKATSGSVKGSKAQLCWDCTVEYEAQYKGKDAMADDYEPRSIECIDCGKIVYISEFNSKSCRCAECQNDADKRLNREASRERMKKYRETH